MCIYNYRPILEALVVKYALEVINSVLRLLKCPVVVNCALNVVNCPTMDGLFPAGHYSFS